MALHEFGVKAVGSVTFLDSTLPSGNAFYESVKYTKTINNYQFYRNSVTKTDGFPYGEIKVLAKTKGSNGITSALVLGTNEQKTWGNNYANVYEGEYSVLLARENWSVFKASHWGTWILDERLANIN